MSANTEQKVFLTFGGGKTWPNAARRLNKQAGATGIFDGLFIETSENFFAKNPEFFQHRSFVEANPKGWGYWIWKPFLLLKYLNQLRDGDMIIYLDAGCEILPENRAEFAFMLDHLKKNGTIFFDWSDYPIFNLPFWTKQSLLDEIQKEFGLSDLLRVSNICAGGLGLVKCPKNIAFLTDWYRLATKDNYHLIDDTPSKVPQKYLFFGHRHDQSIMSALKAVYKFPNYRFASEFDYTDIGEDFLQVALAQPFLMSRNPTEMSKIEQFKRSPLPAGQTSATRFLADALTRQFRPMLANFGLIQSRNSLCYCGSGKRFKHCHGELKSRGIFERTGL